MKIIHILAGSTYLKISNHIFLFKLLVVPLGTVVIVREGETHKRCLNCWLSIQQQELNFFSKRQETGSPKLELASGRSDIY